MGMNDLLKSLMGQALEQGKSQGDDPLTDMLEGVLGGALEAHQDPNSPLDLGDVLGSILGGGAENNLGAQAGLGGLIGGILGSGGDAQAGGLGDILGAVLGGTRGEKAGYNPFLAPIINGLAERVGLPPQIASAIVGFLFTRVFASAAERGHAAQEVNLDHLLEGLKGDPSKATQQLDAAGLLDELVAETGLDRQTAEKSLQEAFQLLGGQVEQVRRTRPANAPDSRGLDQLLDSWR
ncbi:MAG: hypothetical protein D6775_12415 [Caldilineae bacterium]|nr:MAG: hypothetical protein D6775_12415 [Caldilineae bacterium]